MAVAQRFYDAFAMGDWGTMARLYAPQATFSDPVFPRLNADQARAMWGMLLSRATDLECSSSVEGCVKCSTTHPRFPAS